MNRPPRCPYRPCPNHRSPQGKFFTRHGTYQARCRSQPVKRYRCKVCKRTFSDQTFRTDRHDKKPHLNGLVIDLLRSGVGFRQGARVARLSRRNFTRKARKLAHAATQLDANLQTRARRMQLQRSHSLGFHIQMDELESHEDCRYSRPVVVANVIEVASRFQIASQVASIRPKGKMSERRIRQIDLDEARFGRRSDESPQACLRAFKAAAWLFPLNSGGTVDTDKRPTYPGYIRKAFRGRKLLHRTCSGRAPRGFGTMLHPINLMEAIARDHMGRVRRDSWLATKRRRYLQLFFDLHRAVKNWTMPRFNRDRMSPGQLIGFAPRMLRLSELFRWRQDWGQLSPCPFGDGRRSLLDLHSRGVTPGPSVRVCA